MKTRPLRCSFCGKSQTEVKKLIAGPGAYICNECIDLCNDIIVEEIDEQGGATCGHGAGSTPAQLHNDLSARSGQMARLTARPNMAEFVTRQLHYLRPSLHPASTVTRRSVLPRSLRESLDTPRQLLAGAVPVDATARLGP